MSERSAATKAQIASYLGFLLRRARVAAARLSADLDLGESVRHVAILSVLTDVGPTSQQWLADYLGINRSVMVRVVDALEMHGDVVRSRSPSDRRSYALAVTAQAERCLSERAGRLAAVGERLSQGLPAGETAQLTSLLLRLVDSCFVPELPPLLASSLVFLLTEVHHRLELEADAELRRLGSSVRTYLTLAKLKGSACSQVDLAGHILVGPAAVVELIDALEQSGLVRRERSVSDRRSYELKLTEAGEIVRGQSARVIRDVTRAFTARLTAREKEELISLLDRLSAPASLPTLA